MANIPQEENGNIERSCLIVVEVCSNCGHDILATDEKGNRICPICDGHEFEKHAIKAQPKCCYCERKFLIIKGGGNPPFYEKNTNTYYCGCRGWD